MMNRTISTFAIAAGLIGLATWAGNAQEPKKGVAQKIGESVDSASKSVKKGLKGAEESVKERFAKVRGRVHDMEVESRVYSRLHWDKMLSASTIELEVKNDGVATVRGMVPNNAAKKKAIGLTIDTVGVTKVVDLLTIPSPAGIQEK